MKKNERVKLFGPNLRMGWVGPGPPLDRPLLKPCLCRRPASLASDEAAAESRRVCHQRKILGEMLHQQPADKKSTKFCTAAGSNRAQRRLS